LRKAFDGWQIPDDPKSGAVLGGLQGAEAHYKKLSEKFGYSIPVPESNSSIRSELSKRLRQSC
jgi:hypothetical protein